MGTEERKAREKQRRRNNILNAAEEVIFSKGLDQATMDEIAERAELSKGTLYLYFKNKNELYLAICEHGSTILNGRFAKVFTEDKPGVELIRLLGETYIDFVKNNPDYFNAFMFFESFENIEELESSCVARSCQENARESLTYIVRALQIGMQDGSITSDFDPKDLALQIWGSTRGLIQLGFMKMKGLSFGVLDGFDLDVEKTFRNYMALVHRAIATEQKLENTD